MRIFLDANILFSAAWKDDADAALLFELGEAGYCELSTSRLAAEEARRNIALKRPDKSARLERLLASIPVGMEPGQAELAAAGQHGLPDKDIPILAAAIAQHSDWLVTGDRRDFGHLYGGSPGGVKVVNLPDAIEGVLNG